MQSGSSCTSPRSGGRRACSRSPSASRRQQLSTTYTWVGSTRGRASLGLETMSLFVDEKVSAAHRALARGGRFLCDRLWRCAVAARTSRRVQPRAAGGRVLAEGAMRCGGARACRRRTASATRRWLDRVRWLNPMRRWRSCMRATGRGSSWYSKRLRCVCVFSLLYTYSYRSEA